MLSQENITIWCSHVLASYPNEACALVRDGVVIPVPNIHSDPTNHFMISPLDLVRYSGYQMVLHSHISCYGREDQRTPSYHDQQSQIKSGVTWGISSTDGLTVSPLIYFGDDVAISPLEGRTYLHGVWDCWGLVRDYYRLQGYQVKNYPRGNDWWEHGKALISDDALLDAGFIKINISNIQVGDLLTYRINSPVTNHFAIYTGPNEILHQLCFRLSGYDSYSKWRKFFVGAYRILDK